MIKLQNVRKEFAAKAGKTVAVKDFSIEINKGELVIFLGPSGCGKTTSLKMINRIIPLTSGRISIDGVDIMKMDPNVLRRGIGYAIQNIGLFPHLTVAGNIATVPMLKKWPREKQRARAEELLHLVGMEPWKYLDRYPAELSGGQQQRVGVARALGADPPILLMDEPFGAIDPITRGRLQDEFLKIQGKLKKTVVFVTHDIDEAIKMGDRIALLQKGELIQYDTPGALLSHPKNEFVGNFVGSDHVLKGLCLYKAGEVMQPPALMITRGEEPGAVKKKMQRAQVQWAVCVDERKLFLGWIFFEDLHVPSKITDILRPAGVVAVKETPLNEALSLMLKGPSGDLAVLDDHRRLCGVISYQILRDIFGKQFESSCHQEDRISG